MPEKYCPDWDAFVLRLFWAAVFPDGVPTDPDQHYHSYVANTDLTKQAADFLAVDNGEVNSVRTMVGRAVDRLIERGDLIGWYRCWYRWTGKTAPMGEDMWTDGSRTGETPWAPLLENKRQRPRLAYLQLTDQGAERCRQFDAE